jgi:hypothetical protein
MQALWQRLTDKVRGEIGRVDQNIADVGQAATDAQNAASLAQQGVNAATQAAADAQGAANLAQQGVNNAFEAANAANAAAGTANEALEGIGEVLVYLAAVVDYQGQVIDYLNAAAGLLLQLLTILDDPTQPLSPPVDPTSFLDFPLVQAYLAAPPTPPVPPA